MWVLVPEIEVLRIAAVWTGHIGMDRMVGYGLKDPPGSKDTHLQHV